MPPCRRGEILDYSREVAATLCNPDMFSSSRVAMVSGIRETTKKYLHSDMGDVPNHDHADAAGMPNC